MFRISTRCASEGARSMSIELDMRDSTPCIYVRAISAWDPPHEAEAVTETKRGEIVQRGLRLLARCEGLRRRRDGSRDLAQREEVAAPHGSSLAPVRWGRWAARNGCAWNGETLQGIGAFQPLGTCG